MRAINLIVIHCSATPPSMDIGAEEIRLWHTKQNGWSDIGYHFVIRRDGRQEEGRPLERIGAHAKGFNKNSIGICYVGGVDENLDPEDNRTDCQKDQLLSLLYLLKLSYPAAQIVGHCDLPGVTKACPSFNAKMEYQHL